LFGLTPQPFLYSWQRTALGVGVHPSYAWIDISDSLEYRTSSRGEHQLGFSSWPILYSDCQKKFPK
jgi:hypothetical protein